MERSAYVYEPDVCRRPSVVLLKDGIVCERNADSTSKHDRSDEQRIQQPRRSESLKHMDISSDHNSSAIRSCPRPRVHQLSIGISCNIRPIFLGSLELGEMVLCFRIRQDSSCSKLIRVHQLPINRSRRAVEAGLKCKEESHDETYADCDDIDAIIPSRN
jgi:hypothetical protein